MGNDKKYSNSFEDPDERLKKIIDDKKNESSALRKILKSLHRGNKDTKKKSE